MQHRYSGKNICVKEFMLNLCFTSEILYLEVVVVFLFQEIVIGQEGTLRAPIAWLCPRADSARAE